jgi:hypothetical protein
VNKVFFLALCRLSTALRKVLPFLLPPDGTLEGNAYIDVNIIYNKYSKITYDLC